MDPAGHIVDEFPAFAPLAEDDPLYRPRPPRVGASIERTAFDASGRWVEAHSPWPGSRGDWGSPGQGYSLPPPPPTPEPTPTPSPAPLPIAPPDPLPVVRISEVMADPQAVYDDAGEWFEIANLGVETVNLAGWTLADSRTDRHQIAYDVHIAPGQYAVFARNGEPQTNGGVHAVYVYTGLTLANAGDDLLLVAPWGQVMDAVHWGGESGLPVRAGRSLERLDWGLPAAWAYAHAPWPGSAGDWGSPAAAYVPPPTPSPPPAPTPHPAHAPRIRLSELMIDPHAVADEDGEWIELVNLEAAAVNLKGWMLHDDRQDHHTIATDLWIAPGEYLVLARRLDAAVNGGVHGAYEYQRLRLANDGDALALVAPWGVEVDRLVWGRDVGLPVRRGQSLERTDFTADGQWVAAWQPWPGSAGDWGSPGMAYRELPAPPLPEATVEPPSAPVAPTATPPPAHPPRLAITEVMADPQAVPDHLGEWIEIHNFDTTPVNLEGWTLADLGQDRHTIAGELWLPPGAYAVLARHGDPAANGGVTPDYIFSGIQLANERDALILSTPWDVEIDRIVWGKDSGIPVRAGRSLERVWPFAPDQWIDGAEPWPGSAGDWGTPGQAFRLRAPEPTATPPPPSVPVAPALGERWLPVGHASDLVIDQVYYHGGELEFVTLLNRGAQPLDLHGYLIGDAARPGAHQGLYTLPQGVRLAPGALFVIAYRAHAFHAYWGRLPHAQISESDAPIPTLARRGDLASGVWSLNDSGDEVVLLTPDLRLADIVVYGDGDYAAGPLEGRLRTSLGDSLQRVPGPWFPAVTDQRHRFVYAPAAPFATRSLPHGAHAPPVELPGGYRALWGSLGVASNFTAFGVAPPHYLAAAAAADGLDFLAIADDEPALERVTVAHTDPGLILIPAWRWTGSDGSRAVVYSHTRVAASHWSELLPALAPLGGVVQAQGTLLAQGRAPSVIQADDISAPGGALSLYRAWRDAGAPILPAGNAMPRIPGISAGQTRYTGLAVTQADSQGVLAAMAQRRGWLASRPGLWLTLRSAAGVWMGDHLPAAESVTLLVDYGDRFGAPAGLALWQNDRIIAQLDFPPPDGRWQVEIAPEAGAFLYAVATLQSGDFAVTAPLLVVPAHGPTPVAQPPPVAPPQAAPLPQPAPSDLSPTHGQATGPPGSLAMEKLRGLNAWVEFRAQVTVPPGLFNAAIYVAEPARLDSGAELDVAGLGIQVYLAKGGVFPPMAEGDWVLVKGRLRSHRGELEVAVDAPEQVWRIGPGTPLKPLLTHPAAVGESLEGRLITIRGAVVGWQGDSIYLADLHDPHAEAVRVTVRSSLAWKRPFVQRGEIYTATGVVSQFAQSAPWNGGYRLLVRYAKDLTRTEEE